MSDKSDILMSLMKQREEQYKKDFEEACKALEALEDKAKKKEEQLKREVDQATKLAQMHRKVVRITGQLTESKHKDFYRARADFNRAFGTNYDIPEMCEVALEYFILNWPKMNPKTNLTIVDDNGRPIDEIF